MAHNQNWIDMHLPDMTGKRVLVTGANSGIGLETVRTMAARGAEVILACRDATISASLNEKSAQEAIDCIRGTCPQAKLDFIELDLADLNSIKAAAEHFYKCFWNLDILINNAGVMWTPQSKTKDGFETHIGVNHLGHFALTGLLLTALLKSPEPRIVTVSSLTHLTARLDLDDLFFERRKYSPTQAYAQSKLANLLFCRELGRRLEAENVRGLSVAAHPGSAGTNLMVSAFRNSRVLRKFFTAGLSIAGQNAQDGALPTLYAATNGGMGSGDYIGPRGFFGLSGQPAPAYSTKASKDMNTARELWAISEKLTGVQYSFRASTLSNSALTV
jgi:NAD(P)-dependent dehydrogenase (short-subunit alcohol dehydrogenase family)